MFKVVRLKKLPIILGIVMVFTVSLCLKAAQSRGESENSSALKVPIIMYHNISSREDLWGDYVISPQLFEEDMIYLKNEGYEAITVNELIMHQKYGTELPQKPVIITLDDGQLSSLTKALPIIKKHDLKMTVSVVGSYAAAAMEQASPDDNTDYLDDKDINALRESGVCEIACHSYDMHSLDDRRGVLRNKGESFERYRSAFLGDILKVQNFFNDKCGFKANVFCYPYGFYDSAAQKVVKSAGFEAALTCEEGINIITDEQSLYTLKRFNRPYGSSSREFFEGILK
ncbi:MAG: polysaccharide deacetylase family protein [Ruminococcus sp.]|nr:polysaccharide deacetylase family protein [Ruminococcus sp.]MBR1749383.1 polysaccharide deacetylase family protein [Ruminococcus sp.]